MDIPAFFTETAIPMIVWLILYLVCFIVAKWTKDLFTPYSLNDELTEHDNLAIALVMAGYYLGFTLVYWTLMSGPGGDLKADILSVASYSVACILILNLCRFINDKFILKSFCNVEKLTKEHDLGVGFVQFSVYLATGLIAAGAVSGEGGWLTFIVFFVLGQVSMVLFSILYNAIAPFDIHAELQQKNTAAAITFSGNLIALGIVVSNGVKGDFVAWQQDLISFAISIVVAFLFIPLLQMVMDRLVIPGKSLKDEIKRDKNIGAGLLEAVITISFAAIVVRFI